VEEPLIPAAVCIREVGPRDGIQSEKVPIATDQKVQLIEALSHTGLRQIEAVSFVSPKAVPQMADAREVWSRLDRDPQVFYSALVPNRRGAEIAAECGVDGMQVFIAASDSYNLKNVKKPVRDSMADVRDVVEVAGEARIPVEGTISTSFGCPYEGNVVPARVTEVSRWMVDAGIDVISYGDTTGMATPKRVRDLVESVRDTLPHVVLNMHFHDTRGTGLANVITALDLGLDYFDASVGGMGGSPFAQGATGNIATEDLVHMLEDMDVSTGVDLQALLAAARLAQEIVGAELPGKVLKAGPRLPVSASNRRS
jgi:hydroxymethylglutaryl-CoA lyase